MVLDKNYSGWLRPCERKNILFPQYNILFPQLISLFPQERYFVPTIYYLVPSIYYIGVRRLFIRLSIVNFSFKNLLWSKMATSGEHSLTLDIREIHSKIISTETTGSIRTKLGHNSPWIILFVSGKSGSNPRWRQAVVKYRGLWDSLRNMVQVSDNSSSEPLVVIVKNWSGFKGKRNLSVVSVELLWFK